MGRRDDRRRSSHSPKGAKIPLVLDPLKTVCVEVVCKSFQLNEITYSTYSVIPPPLRCLGRPNAISAVSRKKALDVTLSTLALGKYSCHTVGMSTQARWDV